MTVSLRLATEQDLELMMAWRSSPFVYEGFYTQKAPLTWEEHWKWFHNRGNWWKIFIIQYDDKVTRVRDVGVVTVGQLEHWSPEPGYYLGEVSLWGKGIGREAVLLALQYIKNYGREYARTTILDTNSRSIKLAKSLGFKYSGVARVGESWYQVDLSGY